MYFITKLVVLHNDWAVAFGHGCAGVGIMREVGTGVDKRMNDECSSISYRIKSSISKFKTCIIFLCVMEDKSPGQLVGKYISVSEIVCRVKLSHMSSMS